MPIGEVGWVMPGDCLDWRTSWNGFSNWHCTSQRWCPGVVDFMDGTSIPDKETDGI
jgi:hypothetical protein